MMTFEIGDRKKRTHRQHPGMLMKVAVAVAAMTVAGEEAATHTGSYVADLLAGYMLVIDDFERSHSYHSC